MSTAPEPGMPRTTRSRMRPVGIARRCMAAAWLLTALVATACRPAEPRPSAAPASLITAEWCTRLPRAENLAFERVSEVSRWFDVRQVGAGVFALIEPRQFQETISYLILGSDRALLLDTGLGLVPIRPVIERLTRLPVRVINSHTHYDHVGGNAEFDDVLALDTPYTRANLAGFPHEELAGEVAPEAFCDGAPAGADTAAFFTRPWRATRLVRDGDRIDLGGRTIEVLHVPGHTPDALALLDRDAGLLWTGDTYYDATIWLYVPETDLDAYERSLARLAAFAPGVSRLLPAHNTVSADPGQLSRAADAIRRIRAGAVEGMPEGGNRMVFAFDGFRMLIANPLLEGRTGDPTRGGSGLTLWP